MFLRLRLVGQVTGLFVLGLVVIFLFGMRETRPYLVQVSPSSPQPILDDPSKLEAVPSNPRNDLTNPKSDPDNPEADITNLEFPEQEVVPLDAMENDLLYRPPLDVAFIFTHAKDNFALQGKLKVAVGSLLRHASAPLRLHLITDEDGFHIASEIISGVQAANQLDSRYVKLVYVSGLADEFLPEIKSSVNLLVEFFTRRSNAYYRDALFFFSLHLHRLLPELDRIILMDIDIKVKGDIAELHSHFERFAPTNVMGMSLEQSSVYRHILSIYRKAHPNTTLGSPPGFIPPSDTPAQPTFQEHSLHKKGFPGYNSGVVLVEINKLKTSKIIANYLSRSKLTERTQHYNFHGHLGDQDLYTLIALDHPELFYTLPCSWNKQLCTWWRDHGYTNVFDEYFKCNEELKIVHGNCKTPIPDDDR